MMVIKLIKAVALVFVLLLSGTAYAGLMDGLVAYYPFNGNANDESGNGNDAIVYGATLAEDRFGNYSSAYSFDGDDKITLLESYARQNQESFALWAKVDDLAAYAGGRISFILCLGFDKYKGSFKIFNINNTYGFGRWIYSDPDKKDIWDPADLDSDWHLFVYTRNDDSHKFYKDGVLIGVITDTESNLTRPLELSNHPHAWYPYPFLGRIDDVRIYNRTLSKTEIKELYFEGLILEDTMPPTGAVHAYPDMIWPPNNKMVTVILSGYVMDEMCMARDGNGIGVSSAALVINGTDTIILRDADTDLLDDNGNFSVNVEVQATKGAEYLIELRAADTNPEVPNAGVVDTTVIHVPKNLKSKKTKK